MWPFNWLKFRFCKRRLRRQLLQRGYSSTYTAQVLMQYEKGSFR